MKIKVESSRCTGCRSCEIYCSWANFKELNPQKSAIRIRGKFPSPGKYSVILCNQCGSCVEACPVEAIKRQDEIIIIDKDTCSGCGTCVKSCPSGAVFAQNDVIVPLKCIACGECLDVCATGAICRN